MKMLQAYYPLLVILTILDGCTVLSLEPFYTDDLVIEMPALAGEWLPLDRDGNPVADEGPWVFENNSILTFGDRDNFGVQKSGLLKVTYFSVNGLLFADTTVEDIRLTNFQAIHLVSGHVLSTFQLENDRLTVKYLDSYWFTDFLLEHPFPGFVKRPNDDYFIMNTPSQVWVDFLEKYGTDEKAFPEDGALRFIRKIEEKK